MDTQNESLAPEELNNSLPSPEQTAELIEKAKRVTTGLDALKQSSRLRPFVGKSADGKFSVVIRDYKIEEMRADPSLETASTQEIVSHLLEAHSNAVDVSRAWVSSKFAEVAKFAGITGDFGLPF